MRSDKETERICDRLLQNLGDKSKAKLKLGFWCILNVNSMYRATLINVSSMSGEHSLQSNPDNKR